MSIPQINIAPYVQDEFNRRKSDFGAFHPNPDPLSSVNDKWVGKGNRSVWIRVASGVQIDTPRTNGDITYGVGTTQNGQFFRKREINNPVRYNGFEFNPSTNANDQYSIGSDQQIIGYDIETQKPVAIENKRKVPAPIVSSINVESIGDMGLIAKADLNFKVYSEEQIRAITDFFCIAGKTVVLEWGFSSFNGTFLDLKDVDFIKELMTNRSFDSIYRNKTFRTSANVENEEQSENNNQRILDLVKRNVTANSEIESQSNNTTAVNYGDVLSDSLFALYTSLLEKRNKLNRLDISNISVAEAWRIVNGTDYDFFIGTVANYKVSASGNAYVISIELLTQGQTFAKLKIEEGGLKDFFSSSDFDVMVKAYNDLNDRRVWIKESQGESGTDPESIEQNEITQQQQDQNSEFLSLTERKVIRDKLKLMRDRNYVRFNRMSAIREEIKLQGGLAGYPELGSSVPLIDLVKLMYANDSELRAAIIQISRLVEDTQAYGDYPYNRNHAKWMRLLIREAMQDTSHPHYTSTRDGLLLLNFITTPNVLGSSQTITDTFYPVVLHDRTERPSRDVHYLRNITDEAKSIFLVDDILTDSIVQKIRDYIVRFDQKIDQTFDDPELNSVIGDISDQIKKHVCLHGPKTKLVFNGAFDLAKKSLLIGMKFTSDTGFDFLLHEKSFGLAGSNKYDPHSIIGGDEGETKENIADNDEDYINARKFISLHTNLVTTDSVTLDPDGNISGSITGGKGFSVGLEPSYAFITYGLLEEILNTIILPTTDFNVGIDSKDTRLKFNKGLVSTNKRVCLVPNANAPLYPLYHVVGPPIQGERRAFLVRNNITERSHPGNEDIENEHEMWLYSLWINVEHIKRVFNANKDLLAALRNLFGTINSAMLGKYLFKVDRRGSIIRIIEMTNPADIAVNTDTVYRFNYNDANSFIKNASFDVSLPDWGAIYQFLGGTMSSDVYFSMSSFAGDLYGLDEPKEKDPPPKNEVIQDTSTDILSVAGNAFIEYEFGSEAPGHRMVAWTYPHEKTVLDEILSDEGTENFTNPFKSVGVVIPGSGISLTFDGISGIEFFNTFNCAFIPDPYQQTGVFIVNGISHSIESSNWTTTINGMFKTIDLDE